MSIAETVHMWGQGSIWENSVPFSFAMDLKHSKNKDHSFFKMVEDGKFYVFYILSQFKII